MAKKRYECHLGCKSPIDIYCGIYSFSLVKMKRFFKLRGSKKRGKAADISKWSGNSCGSHSSLRPQSRSPSPFQSRSPSPVRNASLQDRHLCSILDTMTINNSFDITAHAPESQSFLDFCIQTVCVENIKFLLMLRRIHDLDDESYVAAATAVFRELIDTRARYQLNLGSGTLQKLSDALRVGQSAQIRPVMETARAEIQKMVKNGTLHQFTSLGLGSGSGSG
jgi:hypothetical protein